MKCDIRVATPPPKPLMVFDGDCNFCTLWIRRWQQMTGDRVDYLPAQDLRIATRFPEIPREQFDTAVQLIETDGSVYGGAQAVFLALAHGPKHQWPLRTYQNSSAFADASEWAYRLVARKSEIFLLADPLVLGAACRTADAFSYALDFFARAGRGLPHRVRFVVDANQRIDRPQRYFANRPVHVRGRSSNATCKASAWTDFVYCRRCVGSILPTVSSMSNAQRARGWPFC